MIKHQVDLDIVLSQYLSLKETAGELQNAVDAAIRHLCPELDFDIVWSTDEGDEIFEKDNTVIAECWIHVGKDTYYYAVPSKYCFVSDDPDYVANGIQEDLKMLLAPELAVAGVVWSEETAQEWKRILDARKAFYEEALKICEEMEKRKPLTPY